MAVHAQFAGCLPPCVGGGLAGEQMRALLSAARGNKGHQYYCSAGVVSAAQSELTSNGGGGGGVPPPPRKRGREDELGFEHYVASSSAALLPIPGMQKVAIAQQSPAAVADRTLDSALTSTSRRPATTASAAEDALVSELCRQQVAGIDALPALVRAECERLRAGLEQASKRQCLALAGAARLLRAKEAELDAARRRAAVLDERLRQAAAESQAWCGLARRNEAAAAALDTLLLGGADAAGAPARPAEEGFGESDPADAASFCIAEAEHAGACAAASSSPLAPAASKGRACRACGGGGEASVLVLPCRHLCLCKACEPRWDACPVCLAAKTASIHVAADW